jgi:hypothetical protein
MQSPVHNTFNPPWNGQNDTDRHRRLRAVIIDMPFADMFTIGHIHHQKCTEGLPEGARFIGAVTVEHALSVACVFEHESFEPVKSGHYIPAQRIVYEVVTE